MWASKGRAIKNVDASITNTARSRRSPLLWLTIGIVAGALVVPPGVALAEAVREVLITNDASNPVPVAAQGTTAVAGTVDVGNTVPVIAGGEPLVITLSTICGDELEADVYTVPEAQRLVVEDVTGFYTAPQGERRRPILIISGRHYDLPQTFADTGFVGGTLGHADHYALHESLHTYAEGGWRMQALMGCPAGEGGIRLVVSGYLVNTSRSR